MYTQIDFEHIYTYIFILYLLELYLKTNGNQESPSENVTTNKK